MGVSELQSSHTAGLGSDCRLSRIQEREPICYPRMNHSQSGLSRPCRRVTLEQDISCGECSLVMKQQYAGPTIVPFCQILPTVKVLCIIFGIS